TPNIDYSVDYSTGTVVIKNNAALLSQDLKISYETNDLFTLASKTFLGLRGDYRISEKSRLGFTFVNLKQETLNDKVRIGEEPTNNTMFGLDFTTEFPTKLLTNIVNLLPGYNTKVPSFIQLRGEIAAINPDPNTKKSIIPQDNNEAVAYIDDMEGAKKVISLGGTYNTWTIGSVPLDNTIGPTDSLTFKQSKRGKLKWYNISNSELLTNIYINKDVQTSQNTITPFYIVYNPQRRGTYNYNGKYDTIPDKSTSWNGIMKYLNTTSNDLVNENINFIEFSMKIEKTASTGSGKLIIDLGNISQDAIPNKVLNTEDTLGNGELRLQDDLGVDYKSDDDERAIYRALNGGENPPAGEFTDPALDNNSSTGAVDYNIINGTQNNLNFEGGRRPDTEDLNKTSNVNNGNDYFQFEISLDTANNPYIVGEGKEGWRQFKVPLSEFKRSYGNAAFTNIQFARMWITGVADSIRLSMYDINLTGNQWVKQNKTDTTYNITVVSIEENSTVYRSPIEGDALRQTVRGQNNVNTKSNEQSLSLEVNNLTNGVRKIARKDFSSAPIDLFNYRAMKLFVNGDPSFNYTNEAIYDATMVIRFGNDSNNYYEYRAPVHPDNRPGSPWSNLNEVTINFNDLTKIKLARDSTNVPVQDSVGNGPPGAEYKIFGNPDLQSIKEIILGVEKNRSALNTSISGSVWFNELRLVNVIDNDGIALNISSNIQFADLLNLNFALSKTDPFFHSLDTRIGSRTTGLSWDFSATLNLHKFINNMFASIISEEWSNFITLPITFRHTEGMVNPRYYPGTDIELEKAAEERYIRVLQQTGSIDQALIASDNIKKEAQTLTVRNNISITGMQFNLPSNNFLIKSIFNKLLFNFNTDFGNSRDLTFESKNDFRYSGGVSIGTDFGLSDKFNINLGNLLSFGDKYKTAKLYFFFPFIPLAPLFSNNFSAATDFNRSRIESKQRKFTSNDFTTRDFKANRGFRFDWKFIENWVLDIGGNYDFRAGSDLTPFELQNDSVQRSGSEIFDAIFFNNGLVNFGKDLDYIQTVAINPRFNLPYLDRFLTLSGNYTARYGWVNPNQNVNVGFNTTVGSSIVSSATFKLQEIFSMFGGGTESKLQANGVSKDTIKQEEGKKKSFADILNIFKTFVPGDINVSFTQNNAVANGGVIGHPGFGNFWFYPTAKDEYGPSRTYQMGFSLYPGQRAPNLTQIGDSYLQANELSFTSNIKPIFPESVSMSLNFKTSWGFTNSLIYTSNGVGDIGFPTSKTSAVTNGNTIFFAGDVKKFSFDYDVNNPTLNRVNLTNEFKNQISSFPFPNWSLTINGLEKFPLFAQFATSVTLDNSFVSEYRESKLIDINAIDIPNSQSVTQAFSPLLGLNFNFKEVLGGSLNSTFRINKGVTNNLNPIGASIQTLNTSEWSINANFAKTGFNLPLFGLSLQNDITFALTVSKLLNEPINYELGTGRLVPVAGNGSSVMTINPSVQYSLSSKVSMQLFYKYINTQPTGSTVTTVPRTSKEGGLNIRITIQ
ncbi:MAG: cell surface protein SprA, partial [Ignavibacteria bacterium]